MAFFGGEFLAALLLIIFTTWIYCKQKWKHLDSLISPPGYPILGNALEVKSTIKLLDTLIQYSQNYGGMVKINIGPFDKIVLISDYKLLEHILSSQKTLNKSYEYKFLHKWLGSGLLTSTATKWKKHRRVITPTFHFKILEQFIDVFEDCGMKLVHKLKKESGTPSLDIYGLVTLCTLDIICETAMGTSINAQEFEDSEYVRSVKEILRILLERTTSIFERHDLLYPLTRNYYVEKRALSILKAHTNKIIVQRRQELHEMKAAGDENKPENDLGIKKKKAFLDLLLEVTVDGRTLTHEEIREEVDTFMFEGHDTTASAISFILYCIANHAEVQKLVLEEQVRIFAGNKNPKVVHNDLQNMKYLELVIKETLRLYPSVPFYGRQISERIDFDGGFVPENVGLVLFAYGIQRNAKYFENPEVFNPNRFAKIDGSQPFAYLPFSAGPRNCIGQKFAMLEMKSTVSKIVRHFELSPAIPAHKLILASEAVLKSVNGIRIGIKARD